MLHHRSRLGTSKKKDVFEIYTVYNILYPIEGGTVVETISGEEDVQYIEPAIHKYKNGYAGK